MSFEAEIAALTDIASGQTLAEAGHADRHNQANAALRALADFVDDAGPVTSVNGESGVVVLTAADVQAVPQASGIQYREYNGSAWPVRGTVPTGTVVMWIKRTAADPDPPINATYALAGVDIALLAQA